MGQQGDATSRSPVWFPLGVPCGSLMFKVAPVGPVSALTGSQLEMQHLKLCPPEQVNHNPTFPTTLGEPQVIPQVIKSRGVTEVGVLIIPVYTDKKAPLAAMLLYLTYACVCARLLQSCPTLCHPVDCSPLGSSVHEVLQA